MNWHRHHTQHGGSAPATPGFTAVAPEWLIHHGAADAAPAIPAAESTLGSHPCVALYSAQVLPEWTTSTSPCNDFSSNGDNPLNFVSHSKGSLQDKHRLTQVGRAMKELGVQMIAAYSPQARGRSERNFGTWQGRLPQELRLAGITTAEDANSFLRQRYIGEFNAQFSVPAAEKGTAFRRTGRSDLNWIFTVQTERVVDKDNTVAIRDRSWQIDKTRFRNTLAGSTVTIHEHLDETVSIRYGPHVVGRYDSTGEKLISATTKERRGKGGSMEAGENQRQVSTGSHTPLEISARARDSHFSTAPTTASAISTTKAKAKPKTKAAAA
jgi:hypothetical protein